MDNFFDPQKYLRSRWLKGSDLPRQGKALTIRTISEHTFEQTGETKPVMGFAETPQELALNKTQIGALVAMFGSDPRLWVGKQILCAPAASQFVGRPTIAITPAVETTGCPSSAQGIR